MLVAVRNESHVASYRRRFAVVGLALVGLSTGAFLGAAEIGGAAFVDAQNARQLTDLSQLVLRRAELEVDFAVMALSELAERGIDDCSWASLAAMRRQVYANSTIKDIRIVGADGRNMCSAFSETLAFDNRPIEEIEAFASRNSSVRLARLEQQTSLAMGVLWQVLPERSLAAVVNTDALLFAVLPAALRGHGEVMLALKDGSRVAQYLAKGAELDGDMPALEFEAVSDRYPFIASLRVTESAFQAWDRGLEQSFRWAGGTLGLAFGFLLTGVVVRRGDLATDLDRALARREFKPFLQPIVSLHSGDIVGCEVLARWVKPDGTVEPPLRFIQRAEESGRIVPLTYQLIGEALDQLRAWMNLHHGFTVAFNIHPGHLMSDEFVSAFTALVDAAHVNRGQVVIELTERHELADLKAAAERIAELRQQGFGVAIDDAGTGHSGLSYLKMLGVNIVKIDKLFVDSVELDHSARVIVDMLVRIAGEFGMTTLAEGVERPEQVAALKACGVDEIQGFLISPPLPSFDFLRLLREAGRSAKPRPAPQFAISA